MTITVVEHHTGEPALYAGMAALVAREKGAVLAHLPARFDTGLYADAVQHVAAEGALVPSGLLWIERLAGVQAARETTVDAILLEAQSRDLVLPWHSQVAEDAETLPLVIERAASAGIAVERLIVTDEAGSWWVRLQKGIELKEIALRCGRDRFGRLEAEGSVGAFSHPGPRLRIGLVGTERDHRRVYPAVLAALGDAGDAEGAGIDVVFVPPVDLREHHVDAVVSEINGLVLPGGSDMVNVPGQTLMAAGAMRSHTPTLGLCLGMQTMVTAVAQKVLGSRWANLAELDPSSPIKTFVPLSEEGSLPAHRLGERKIIIARDSRLYHLLGGEMSIRQNHRFRLNPELRPVLAKAGLRVSAHDGSGLIADAIELKDHPFFFGMQGHPELSSRSGKAHLLIRAFVRACRKLSQEGTVAADRTQG